MKEMKIRAWHKHMKRMFWFDVAWGNYGQGDGYIGMLPMTEARVRYHPPNREMIEPESVEFMLYTGRHDKGNGIEVCEDDIVNCQLEGLGGEPSRELKRQLVNYDSEGNLRMGLFCAWFCFDEYVIGNIYENPDLLEGK